MYCPNCGTACIGGGRFCVNCGASVEAAQHLVAKKSPTSGPANTHATVGSSITLNDPTLYASFWRRVAAYLVDVVIAVIAGGLIGLFWGIADPSVETETDPRITLLIVILVFIYTTTMESSPYQATLGKLALGIKVTDLAGQRIGFWRATGRYFAHIASALALGIGYVMAAFTQRRQALHDMMAGTIVVSKAADAAAIAVAGPARPLSGFAIAGLVVLCGIVPILSILAAIAIPAYQDYNIRVQVTEGLNLASAVKTAVAESFANTGAWPTDLDEAGSDSAAPPSGKYVSRVDIDHGTITITYGDGANDAIDGLAVSLTPTLDDQNDVFWLCGYSTGAGSALYEPTSGPAGVGQTDIPEKYLPQSCRDDTT